MNHNITIYTKDGCTKCDEVKRLLYELDLPYTHYTLDEDFTRDWLHESFPGVQSYPVIMIYGRWIDNYNTACSMITAMKKGNNYEL